MIISTNVKTGCFYHRLLPVRCLLLRMPRMPPGLLLPKHHLARRVQLHRGVLVGQGRRERRFNHAAVRGRRRRSQRQLHGKRAAVAAANI